VNDDDLCVCAVCRKPSSIYDCLIVDSPDGEVRVDLVCIKRLWSAVCAALSDEQAAEVWRVAREAAQCP
jgi:uncharacterized hydantoinase/oxoprolinase family protein